MRIALARRSPVRSRRAAADSGYVLLAVARAERARAALVDHTSGTRQSSRRVDAPVRRPADAEDPGPYRRRRARRPVRNDRVEEARASLRERAVTGEDADVVRIAVGVG